MPGEHLVRDLGGGAGQQAGGRCLDEPLELAPEQLGDRERVSRESVGTVPS